MKMFVPPNKRKIKMFLSFFNQFDFIFSKNQFDFMVVKDWAWRQGSPKGHWLGLHGNCVEVFSRMLTSCITSHSMSFFIIKLIFYFWDYSTNVLKINLLLLLLIMLRITRQNQSRSGPTRRRPVRWGFGVRISVFFPNLDGMEASPKWVHHVAIKSQKNKYRHISQLLEPKSIYNN